MLSRCSSDDCSDVTGRGGRVLPCPRILDARRWHDGFDAGMQDQTTSQLHSAFDPRPAAILLDLVVVCENDDELILTRSQQWYGLDKVTFGLPPVATGGFYFMSELSLPLFATC